MTESHEDYVKPTEGVYERAEDATSDGDCCNEVDATDSCFIGKDKPKCGKVKKYYTHSMQMTKYSDKITRGYWPSKERHYILRSIEPSHCR
jgi:hypothetical protein